jgi:NADH dehydrogenase
MRRIVVLGCGFGGFKAARELEASLAGRRRVQLTVVSDRSHFLYTPLLPSVATGELDVAHITFPIRTAFDKSTEVLIEPIEAIDLERRLLRGQNDDIEFDYLLVAVGSQTDWAGQPHWRANSLTFKSARDGVRVREAVTQALEDAADMSSADERARRLTFVVGGAGATGVGLASELLTTLQTEVVPVVSDSIANALRVVLVEKQERVLPTMPEALGLLARTHLREFGMELRLGTAVVGRSAGEVALSTDEIIAADHFLWCGGVRVPDLVAEAGFDVDAKGRINVEDTLEVGDHPGVYAIGDVAGFDADIPQTAHVASQQAPVAARNIIAQLSGRAGRRWEYHYHGEMVALGRQHAVAYIGETALKGRGARTLYRLVHTAMMPTGIKKTQLLKEWLFSSFRRNSSPWGLLKAQPERAQLKSESLE